MLCCTVKKKINGKGENTGRKEKEKKVWTSSQRDWAETVLEQTAVSRRSMALSHLETGDGLSPGNSERTEMWTDKEDRGEWCTTNSSRTWRKDRFLDAPFSLCTILIVYLHCFVTSLLYFCQICASFWVLIDATSQKSRASSWHRTAVSGDQYVKIECAAFPAKGFLFIATCKILEKNNSDAVFLAPQYKRNEYFNALLLWSCFYGRLFNLQAQQGFAPPMRDAYLKGNVSPQVGICTEE